MTKEGEEKELNEMTRDEQIQQLTNRFISQDIDPEAALDYATNTVDGKNYDKFIVTAIGVFIGGRYDNC